MSTEQALKEALSHRDAARSGVAANSSHQGLVGPCEEFVRADLRVKVLVEQIAANHGLIKPTLEEALRG